MDYFDARQLDYRKTLLGLTRGRLLCGRTFGSHGLDLEFRLWKRVSLLYFQWLICFWIRCILSWWRFVCQWNPSWNCRSFYRFGRDFRFCHLVELRLGLKYHGTQWIGSNYPLLTSLKTSQYTPIDKSPIFCWSQYSLFTVSNYSKTKFNH